MKKLKVSYNVEAVEAAAVFLKRHNKAGCAKLTVTAIKENIMAGLEKGAQHVAECLSKKKDWGLYSTMGYTIVFMLEGKNRVAADILVNPAVAKEYTGATLKLSR